MVPLLLEQRYDTKETRSHHDFFKSIHTFFCFNRAISYGVLITPLGWVEAKTYFFLDVAHRTAAGECLASDTYVGRP